METTKQYSHRQGVVYCMGGLSGAAARTGDLRKERPQEINKRNGRQILSKWHTKSWDGKQGDYYLLGIRFIGERMCNYCKYCNIGKVLKRYYW